ncbi:hypothetical protein TELCIR_17107 [Teladorsagia circumcincta]|uniref:Uncharacterized protein n=1 Tax=Teladorsagia circumcincta TaxID=45464 RepID=A0A2G9TTN5_TELCI|nr:hypothetical protein TELCIR_17107 [Teladorsagia circumcincta]
MSSVSLDLVYLDTFEINKVQTYAERPRSWLIVVFILAASIYFYNNHKFLTYVYTADSFERFYLANPPAVVTSMMENECKWPVLELGAVFPSPNFARSRNIKCNAVMNPLASLDEIGQLELSQPVLGGDLAAETNISCYYHVLVNNTVGDVIVGEAIKIEFNEPKRIRHDQFVVRCHRDSPTKDVVYDKAFVNVPMPNGPASEPKFVENDPEQPSIALLMFDSVSLNHFKRSMPRTATFLVDNDFFTFNMYNEMTDNSEENLLSILSGGDDGVEKRAFLWDKMRDRKCLTYMSEEVGDFPSLLGNMSIEVEHDLRPFYKYSQRSTKEHCTPDGRVGLVAIKV